MCTRLRAITIAVFCLFAPVRRSSAQQDAPVPTSFFQSKQYSDYILASENAFAEKTVERLADFGDLVRLAIAADKEGFGSAADDFAKKQCYVYELEAPAAWANGKAGINSFLWGPTQDHVLHLWYGGMLDLQDDDLLNNSPDPNLN